MFEYEIVERGSLYSMNYRMFFKGIDGFISPWHDIPLFANEEEKVLNMVVEIPRFTNAKMEISPTEPLNPIKQDVKKDGKVYFVPNIFPHRGYIWNYGMLPQTWDFPVGAAVETKRGKDPIDIMEIGSKVHKTGDVVQVKILGILGVINESVPDWKLLGIDVSDQLASKLDDIDDVEKYFPGLIETSVNALRDYKKLAGKPKNGFMFDGKFQCRDFAHEVIGKTHEFWKDLVKRKDPIKGLCTECHFPDAAFRANDQKWREYIQSQPALDFPEPLPEDFQKWHFID